MSLLQNTLKSRQDAGHRPFSAQTARRPVWHNLAHRFTDERECLASFLALEAAEVIGEAKPANLLNLVDRELPCGRNLYRLWSKYGQTLLTQSGLESVELAQRENSVLLLIYHPQRLAAYLNVPKVVNFLRLAGYRQPATLKETLRELRSRCSASKFPHEIGAILGYPLKDVAGFMGWVRLPVTHHGPWKVYGDIRPSLTVVAACRQCRTSMAMQLQDGCNPVDCLNRGVLQHII